jgi:hypothetical protein
VLYLNAIAIENIAGHSTMCNNWNTFLKDPSWITKVRHWHNFIIKSEIEFGHSIFFAHRIFHHNTLHSKTPIFFTSLAFTNFIDIAVVVDCAGEELTHHESPCDDCQHDDGNGRPTTPTTTRGLDNLAWTQVHGMSSDVAFCARFLARRKNHQMYAPMDANVTM